MRLTFILLLSVVCARGVAAEPVARPKIFIDLQTKGNKLLSDELNDGGYRNDTLVELPQERLKLADGEEFQIGAKCVVLNGKFAPERPAAVNGFRVGAKISELHILHACGWGAYGGKQNPLGHYQEDGTLIGYYRLNYEDGDWEIIPIVYGRDVRDWWGIWDNFKPTTRSRIAWRGTNDHLRGRTEARNVEYPLRLFLSKWTNPRPQVAVTSIDMVSVKEIAAPFCVGMTAIPFDPPNKSQTTPPR